MYDYNKKPSLQILIDNYGGILINNGEKKTQIMTKIQNFICLNR